MPANAPSYYILTKDTTQAMAQKMVATVVKRTVAAHGLGITECSEFWLSLDTPLESAMVIVSIVSSLTIIHPAAGTTKETMVVLAAAIQQLVSFRLLDDVSLDTVEAVARVMRPGARLLLGPSIPEVNVRAAATSIGLGAQIHLDALTPLNVVRAAAQSMKPGADLCLPKDSARLNIVAAAQSLKAGAMLVLGLGSEDRVIQSAVSGLSKGGELSLPTNISLNTALLAAKSLCKGSLLSFNCTIPLDILIAAANVMKPGTGFILTSVDSEARMVAIAKIMHVNGPTLFLRERTPVAHVRAVARALGKGATLSFFDLTPAETVEAALSELRPGRNLEYQNRLTIKQSAPVFFNTRLPTPSPMMPNDSFDELKEHYEGAIRTLVFFQSMRQRVNGIEPRRPAPQEKRKREDDGDHVIDVVSRTFNK